jgi:trk system potassium uptake protein TrkA
LKIIILGAGQVGSSVAANLAGEANDITVVDSNLGRLQHLQDRFDLRTVHGSASHPGVLAQAGAADADMIIAVTNSDETNMIACQVAYTLFHTPTKIARVRHVEYLKHDKLFAQEALPIDVLISPEQQVTDYIQRLIEFPGALQVLDFADGKVQLVAVRAFYGGPLVGHALRELPQRMRGIETRVAAIFRQGKAIIPRGDTIIESDDDVFFIAAPKHIRAVMKKLRKLDKPNKRIIIAGGGNIGTRLALALEQHCHVKLIELNQERAEIISEELRRTTVLLGDSADEDLLMEENINETDVFCALTNDDEANILSSMLAKRLGARTVMALINRAAYVDLVQRDIIDIAISPQQATIGSLLAHVRRGDVVVVHALRRGAAEAIEAIAHGDRTSSKVVGRSIEEIRLPKGTTIGAIVRQGKVIMVHHDTVIEAEDHVIALVTDKSHVSELESLFQVGVTFF